MYQMFSFFFLPTAHGDFEQQGNELISFVKG